MPATTADFYIQQPTGSLEWVGSKAYDGYAWSTDLKPLIESTTRKDFERALVDLSSHEDFTRPEQGYPFGNKTSAQSPYTYVFLLADYVAIYKRGKPADEDFPKLKFPDLTSIWQPHVKLKTKGAGASINPDTDADDDDFGD